MRNAGSRPSGPAYAHLLAMSDEHGLFEHALFDAPRRDHGYCVDDVGRALIVVVREPDQTPELAALAETYLSFLEDAVDATGRVRNRMSSDGAWTDEPGLGDWWGRALWSTGFAAVHARSEGVRSRALRAFHRAALVRSAHGRAMAFAALGAAEVLSADPQDLSARAVLLDGVATVAPARDDVWPWPEPRLRYANASLPEVLLAGGVATDNPRLLARGLSMLRFLLEIETLDGHLSVTGTGGRGPTQRSSQFDQQPIEVAALADACARAFDVTGDSSWRDGVASAWAWFLGDNDGSTAMFDPASGAGYDGLEASGRNENRGAESTLAALSTYQQARRLGVLELARV
ncbi:glycosyltransferase [Microbacterium sp. CFBP9034]|uniref:glycosyltransferase n=1 Tax=Microbacterium sp. CFBP9034 TaxID=3096540 RepID=UPI002A6A820F|nr:glycosyltransferase [Microbacterium sp. CFBP9034]MDY0909384.1 glycosyltransferase [Microbacterium sp. CFBP9034]